MEVLPVYVFKDSFSSLLAVLNDSEVRYQMRSERSAAPLASSGVVELLLSPGVIGPVVGLLVAFMRRRRGCKVIITTRDNTVIHAEGLPEAELEKVLTLAKNIAIAEPSTTQSEKGLS